MLSKVWHCFDQDSRPAECACSVSVSKMINLLNDSYWKQTHATCTAQHADDWKRDRETRKRIDHNTVGKYHDACATTPVHACWRKNNKRPATRPEETSHNSIGHSTQVSTRIRTHNSFQSRANACRDLLQKSWTFAHTPHYNSWMFVPDHPTCLSTTFPLLTNAVYSSYDAETITPNWNVSYVTGIHNWIWHAPSAMRVHFQIFNWNWFVPSRGHQLFVSFTTPPETHQR